ncbi:response regulator, partial [bacterium]
GLLDETKLTDEQKEYVQTIRLSGDSLLTIINDILDFSKIESGKLNLEEYPMEIRRCIEEAIDLLAPKALDKKINLFYLIQPDVPALILADVTRIRQILVNLVNNAIKFTESGEVFISVSMDERESDTENIPLHISVKDTGIGIPEDKQEKLFQAFSQIETSTTRKFGGTGLGLAICKKLVEMMNGKIWVESIPGEGSTFHFTIKVKASEQVAKTNNNISIKKTKQREEKLSALFPLKILVAEDNIINQKLFLSILKKLGYHADAAANGIEVLDMLKQKKYDIVFMDIQMPEMDGLTATELILENYSPEDRPVIIAMTANAMPGDREICFAAGMSDYLSKPIIFDKLRSVLCNWGEIRNKASRTDNCSIAIIDYNAVENINELDEDGGSSFLNMLIDLFLQDTPAMIDTLKRTADENNYPDLTLTAHSLKGISLNIGAKLLSDVTQKIETKGINEDSHNLNELINSLFQAYNLTCEELKKLRIG